MPSSTALLENTPQDTVPTRLTAALLDEVTAGNMRAWLHAATVPELAAWYASADDVRDRARVREFERAIHTGWTPPNLTPENVMDWQTLRNAVRDRRAGRVTADVRDALTALETARRAASIWRGVLQAVPAMTAAHTADVLRRRATDAQR